MTSFEISYSLLKKDIVADTNRWNLMPYLSIQSRVEIVKMNILPMFLHVFQSVIQIKPIMGWRKPSHNSRWKQIDRWGGDFP